MLRASVRQLLSPHRYLFSQQKKYKVLRNPKQAPKLIFQHDGKCRIFQHKDGQKQLKWIMRVGSFFTIFNSLLLGLEFTSPVFGLWNQISFSLCTGLGYCLLMVFQTLSKRTIKQIHLHNNLQTVDLTFFNAFWKQKTISFHISEFQELEPTYAGFMRVELTSLGKAWIKIEKNEFRQIAEYEETLDCILMGKPIDNIQAIRRRSK